MKYKTNKSLYNHDLEELDKKGDWFNYDIKFGEARNQSKTYITNEKLSDYKKL